jgi:hypothetical protein
MAPVPAVAELNRPRAAQTSLDPFREQTAGFRVELAQARQVDR